MLNNGDVGESLTGAASLLRTMADAGIEVCFANPGTSEMHFVAALGALPQIRPVLGLFEGAVSGMADGYARITGKPALTLLHLGTGFTNAAANLHNARRAKSPIVNVVGDHATTHKRWDSPLKSDIEALARPMSDWLRMAQSTAYAVGRRGRCRGRRAQQPGADRDADPARGHRLGPHGGPCGAAAGAISGTTRSGGDLPRRQGAARARPRLCAAGARGGRRYARPRGPAAHLRRNGRAGAA